jgi:XTP/dITP diphosphohydrolase
VSRAWVLASRNVGKLRELRALFATRGVQVMDLRDAGIAEDAVAESGIESFDTFEENALAKARYFSVRLPGRIMVADDSGLVVDALGGAPGVRSKRWSAASHLQGHALDAENNRLLVASVAGERNRAARFVCAAAYCDGGLEFVARGEVAGEIIDQPLGTHGFGYDAHVFVGELGRTMAEATLVEKEAVSHRGRAFAALLAAVRARRGVAW